MKLIHTTLRRNLRSIRGYGLLLSFCRGKRAAIWLHTEDRNNWAETHVRTNHDGDNEDVVHIEVDIPDRFLRKHADGLYYCTSDIPFQMLGRTFLVERHLVDMGEEV